MKPVYIVDDEIGVRKSMVFFLRTAGYYPRPFACGEDLLEEAASLPPGVVMLDLRMPGLDGLEVTRRLANQRHRLPVVIVTGHGDIAKAVASMKMGAIDFIEKPFGEQSLLGILETVFARLDDQVRHGLEISKAKQQIGALTRREMDVMRGLLEGLANKCIAKRLDLSVRTVEMHRSKLMERLQVKTTAEAIRIGVLAELPTYAEDDAAARLADRRTKEMVDE